MVNGVSLARAWVPRGSALRAGRAYEWAQTGAKPADKNKSCIADAVLAQFADWHFEQTHPSSWSAVFKEVPRTRGMRAARTSGEGARRSE